jgi:hypothetical protein
VCHDQKPMGYGHPSHYENSYRKLVGPWDRKPDQWEFKDPKMEVLYHISSIRPYFAGIFPYIGLGKW